MRWFTLLLASIVVVLTTGFVFVDLDQHGLIRPPPPIGYRNQPMVSWMDRLSAPRDDDESLRSVYPATTVGIQRALQSRDDLLGFCHLRWVHGDSTAPHQATARIRIQPGDDGLAHVVGVDLDTRAGGVQTMQTCVAEALAPLAFTNPPSSGLVVLWTLSLPDSP